MKHTQVSSMFAILSTLAVAIAPSHAQPGSGDEVRISAQISQVEVSPGDTLVVAVVLEHQPLWHTNLNQPIVPAEMEGFVPVSTEVSLGLPEWVEQGRLQWPEPHAVTVNYTGAPIEYLVYEGTAVIFVPLRVSQDAEMTGPIEVPITVSYQACDDSICMMPTSQTTSTSVRVVPAGSVPVSTPSTGVFSGFQASVFQDPTAWAGEAAATTTEVDPASASQTGTGVTGEAGASSGGGSPSGTLLGFSFGSGLIPLAILSFLGGAILNLTPCVLPMIPIKIMTLSQHAGENKSRALVLGIAMFAGVTAFWAALGLPAAIFTSFADPSRLFGLWYVTVPIGALIVLLSLGMMGMFSLTLPQSVYKFSPKADNVFGSFLFGVLTAVFGLPCFGFVAGALIPAAISLGQTAVMTIFVAMGLGMGAPYLLLSVFPDLVKRVPRTGPASELVKQVLGLQMAGFGMFFFGTGIRSLVKTYPYTADSLHVYGLAALTLAAGVWLAYQTFKITPSPAKRGVFGLFGLAFAALGAYIAVSSTQSHRTEYFERQAAIAEAGGAGAGSMVLKAVWNEYTPSLLEKALADGMVVFVDFTADWCINCKVFEAQVLNKEPVRSLLRSDDVAMFKVDLTGSNPDGEKLLEDFGRVGIPTWAVIGPRAEDIKVVTNYTPEAVRKAIEGGRGPTEAAQD